MNEFTTKSGCAGKTLPTIMLVSTDKKLTRSLKQLFESEGYIVKVVDAVVSGFGDRRSPHDCLAIIDLGFSQNSGYKLCRHFLSAYSDWPLIAIGPQSDVAKKISLLDMGARDYVSTPFHPRELLARVRAALRCPTEKDGHVVSFADITVDLQKMEVRRANRTIELGKKCFEMLTLMITNRERVITRQEFVRNVWNNRQHLSPRAVDQQIVKLRQLLETDPHHPIHFRTVHSVGYKFVP